MSFRALKIAGLSLASGLMFGISLSSAVVSPRTPDADFSAFASSDSSIELSGSDQEQTIYCPDTDAWHAHAYENTTDPGDGWESFMYVHRFRIYLHDDFMDSIDLSTLECSTPSGWVSCNGGSSSDYGGVEIELVQNDTSADAEYPDYVEWTYGVDDKTGKPVAPGKNDYDADGTVDTNSDDRSIGETVYFLFNEDDSSASATTTSAIYIKFWNYDQSCGDFEDSSCWEVGEEDGQTDSHWNTHTVTLTTNYECEEALTCSKLVISPATMYVDDVFSDTDFSLTATNNLGDDITNEVDITYQAFQYDGSASTGDIMTGPLNLSNRNSGPVETGDTDIRYRNSLPGDRITAFVSDYEGVSYEGTGLCEVEVEFPYCSDLDITDPSGFGLPTEAPYENNIEIDVDSSTGEDWPYDVTYESTDSNATFDGTTTPYTTDDWTIDSYYSEDVGSNTVSVGLDDENGDGISDDVTGLCKDSFVYITEESDTCLSLEITIPPSDPLTCEEMTAGDVQITWTSFMTSGAPSTGPWLVTSSNSAGTFSLTSGGPIVGTGTYVSTVNTLYYNGADGDTIQVMDMSHPICVDTLESESCEEVPGVCEDLSLSEPYIENADGTTTTIDLTDAADLEILYGESTVCWDYTLNTSDATYASRLIADGFTDTTRSAHTGNLNLTMNETAGSDTGNPASLAFTGFETYTGTLCWENFEAGNELSLFVLGDRLTCSDTEVLPPPTPDAPVCTDLQMTPDTFTMSATDATAGIIPVTIDVQGSDATWTGTLVVNRTGSGSLFYSDGGSSEFSDGHLEIPVSGTSTTVIVFYRNGLAGDTVTSTIQGEDTLCADTFTITQGVSPDNVCEDLDFSEDEIQVDADCEDSPGMEVCVEKDNDEERTIEICYEDENGNDGEFIFEGETYEGCEEITVEFGPGETSQCLDIQFVEVCEEADITVSEDGQVCDDLTVVEEVSPDIVCEDLDFSEEEILVDANCQDSPAMEVCIERDSDDERTIEICYETEDGDDGEFTFEGNTYEGCEEITVEFGPGETSQCLDIQFSEVCEDADISLSEGGQVCDDLTAEEVEMGTFNKFIYTFNFSTEKNAYSDDGVFFSHDEDRAFYTLQYEPTGDEEAITFTDEMWGSDLEGKLGSGDASNGYVRLATTYDELVNSKYNGAYDEYNLITRMGFGDAQEENSDDLAAYVDSAEFQSNFKTYIPYIKMSGAESVLIPECEYDGDDLKTKTVCYDPDHSPTSTEDVVIENAGTVYETYGALAAIRIRYVGVIDSGLDCGDESDECLTEEFENSASVEVYENLDALTDSARLVVLCSYLMTQNAGDVYLEVALEAGSDISCIFVEEGEATSSDYRNVDALVILEDDGGVSTVDTYESTYSGSTVSWCDDDSSGNVIGNLSSYVCEIVAKVTDLWKKTTVESTTESHVSQAIRNAETSQSGYSGNYADWSALTAALTNKNNPDSNILYFAGDPDSDTDTVTLGNLTVPAGAWTVIVEDANLIIAGDIVYAGVSNPGDYKNLPSIAFVVQGGDIYFNDEAGELVGVFYTDQKFDGDERSAVDEQLTIDGSLYGNVQTLIERAKYVGPPTVDGGGIVIRYDSRILLNTPPGLSEYVDINTEKGVN